MAPTYLPGERLTALRRWRPVRTGDVVVVRDPRDAERWLLKRCVGRVGRRLDLRGDNAAASTDSRDSGSSTHVTWPTSCSRRPPPRKFPVESGRTPVDAPVARLAVLSYHTSPLAQPGTVTRGMNVYVRELSSALARLGHDVDVYTRRDNTQERDTVHVEPVFESTTSRPGQPPRSIAKVSPTTSRSSPTRSRRSFVVTGLPTPSTRTTGSVVWPATALSTSSAFRSS